MLRAVSEYNYASGSVIIIVMHFFFILYFIIIFSFIYFFFHLFIFFIFFILFYFFFDKQLSPFWGTQSLFDRAISKGFIKRESENIIYMYNTQTYTDTVTLL